MAKRNNQSYIEYIDSKLYVWDSHGEYRDRNYLKSRFRLACRILWSEHKDYKKIIDYFSSDDFLKNYNGYVITAIVRDIKYNDIWFFGMEE